jgi:hypothetical protein
VLTEMASGGSGTASDSSNLVSSDGSFVGGTIGSVAGPAVSVHWVLLLRELLQVQRNK